MLKAVSWYFYRPEISDNETCKIEFQNFVGRLISELIFLCGPLYLSIPLLKRGGGDCYQSPDRNIGFPESEALHLATE